MRVPIEWLKEYVNIKLAPDELAKLLTMSGIEVSAIEFHGKKIDDVVVGKIKSVESHISRSDLYVYQVDIGKEILQIVSDAPNLKVGDKVPVALHGAKLAKDIKVKKMELHGVESFGMLCRASDLGVSEATGILILGIDAFPGEDIRKVLGLGGYVLDIDILPNRPDCLSIIGIAREIAALTGEKLKLPEIQLKDEGQKTSRAVDIGVKDPLLCPRYMARVIESVNVVDSPEWLQARLIAAGIRPVNNIVDITNYVLLEMGQPLHAFDFRFINGNKLIVRKARKDEKIVTIDGIERVLPSDTLVIADPEKAVAVAGVMGGKESEIDASTKIVLLESAYFEPLSINRTSKNLKLRTESSIRFGRGVDYSYVALALDRAASMIADLANGKVLKGAIDIKHGLIKKKQIVLREAFVNRILGMEIKKNEITSILKRLNFNVASGKDIKVEVPLFRINDITREIDLVEEIARVHGYEKIDKTMPQVKPKEGKINKYFAFKSRLRDILCGHGLDEVVNYSMISPKWFDKLNLAQNDPMRSAVALTNPLSEEASVLRTTLIPSLLQVINNNLRHQNKNIHIFEIGKTFMRSGTELPKEKDVLACSLIGDTSFFWQKGKEENYDFYHLKKLIEVLSEELKINLKVVKATHPLAHPGKCANIILGSEEVGFALELHPDAARACEIEKPVFILEILIEPLFKASKTISIYKPLPKFPAVDRDLAFIAKKQLSFDEIKTAIISIGRNSIENVRLFDSYEGKPVPADHVSLAVSITYRNPEKTLTDDEVNSLHGKVADLLAEKFGIQVRK